MILVILPPIGVVALVPVTVYVIEVNEGIPVIIHEDGKPPYNAPILLVADIL